MAKGEKGKGVDFSIFIFGLLGGLVMLCIVWLVAHNFLSWLMVRTRQHELAAMGWVLHFFIGENGPSNFARAYAASPTHNLSFASTLQVMVESGVYVRYIYSPILVGLGLYLYNRAPTAKFKRNHTMDTLIKQEQSLWPEVSPTLGLNLVKGDLSKGPWRVSLTEWEFARKFDLVQFPEDMDKTPIYTVPGAPKEKNAVREELNRDAARALFIEQLGNLWKGPEKLPPYARGLYAAMAVRVAAVSLNDSNKKKSEISKSDALFRKMAADYAEAKGHISKVDFSWADAIIADPAYGKDKLVNLVHIRHGYVFTVMAMMFQISRSDGVVASALFTWLRPVDRRLWYILNNVGGYTFVPEAAGIAAHWLSEKEIGARLLYPAVDEAVAGLEFALQEYVEEDEYEVLFK